MSSSSPPTASPSPSSSSSSSPPRPLTFSPPSPPSPTAHPPASPSSSPSATPPAPPPAAPSAPPSSIPSALPPVIASAPPPRIPSAAPPATPSAPQPEIPSAPPQPPPHSTSSPPPSSPSVHSPPHTPAPIFPPPSPHVIRRHPAAKPPPSPSPPSTSSSSLSSSLVAGIAVGGVVALFLVVFLCAFCFKKKKRRPPVHYYDDAPPSPPEKDRLYVERWQYNVQPPADHAIKVPPRPPPPYSPEHFSPPLPPPPPPPPFRSLPPPTVLSNSADSGSNYSVSRVPLPPPSPASAVVLSTSTFSYQDLVMATNGFSDANLLGQGGFGYVHRGILPNGKEVAVKQLKAESRQGNREFLAEVEIISRVHHKHLVSFVGYCISGDRRLLVYEYVPNNTLEYHLHGKGQPTMKWSTRLKIALGAAKGVAYLHEDCHPKIIHRDIKASNILLDYKFEAKVADFGLAKATSDDNTHISTRIMGTFGYLAPEYASSGKLTDKSDVFSFGVMLLELITGRRPVDSYQTLADDNLVDWARPLLAHALEDGDYDALVDPKLESEFDHIQMACMIACAASCVRHSARRRPKMTQVVRALEGEDLNADIKASHRRIYNSYGSSENEMAQYNEDMGKMTFARQEYAAVECTAPTRDYYCQDFSGTNSEAQHMRDTEGQMKDASSFGNNVD